MFTRTAQFALAAACLLSGSSALAQHWPGTVEVIPGNSGKATISGHVFEDLNADSQRQRNERGIPGVLVSNGLDIVRTDQNGYYQIAVRPDMDLTVIQPSGWQVPVDHRMVPQFSYTHKPGGSATALRFGGLPDTGPAPEQVNFPLRRSPGDGNTFTCAAIGDSQTYSNSELSQFRDSANSKQHQDDSTPRIHELLRGRQALSLSGHLHTLENIAPGEHYAHWDEAVGITGPAPFRHIVAGAASGHWWQGDTAIDGDAMALQRMGAPKGVLMLEFDGADYQETYVGSRIDPRRGQWVDFNTPAFREWFNILDAWRQLPSRERNATPPVSINDLPDTRILTRAELQQGVLISANVWNGSSETRVSAKINGDAPITMQRTQAGKGEETLIGAEYADPFTVKRQATVGRFAIESTMGGDRHQGYEAYRGTRFQGPPQPQTAIADRSMHLWQATVPADLPTGVHVMEVTSTDRHGRRYTDRVVFEVRDERPDPLHRVEVWEMDTGL